MKRRLLLSAPWLLAAGAHAEAAAPAPAPILLLRHALAPGTGDPQNFRLGDCSTQRNLSESGRAQARRIGEQLRAYRIGAVWTSPWCRTRDTAELAFPEQRALLREEPAFASFFQQPERAQPQTAAALQRLAGWRGPGLLVVVTHQVNITALLGEVPAQGAGYWVAIDADGRPQVRAVFSPGG